MGSDLLGLDNTGTVSYTHLVAAGCMEKGMESISGFMQNTVTEDKARLKKMINGGYRNGKY